MMAIVQKHYDCIDIPSSQTFRSYLPYHFSTTHFHDLELKYSKKLFCNNIKPDEISTGNCLKRPSKCLTSEIWKDLEVQRHLCYDTKLRSGSRTRHAILLYRGKVFCKGCLIPTTEQQSNISFSYNLTN
jgi:hypothetical protein